ncbi:MAG: GGDEF domain-containing protein [Chloroflexota bacterium]
MIDRLNRIRATWCPALGEAEWADLDRILIHTNLSRLRIVAWIVVFSTPCFIAVDAYVGSQVEAVRSAWWELAALRLGWITYALAFLFACRSPASPGDVTFRHRVCEAGFFLGGVTVAVLQIGLGLTSQTSMGIYLLSIFTVAAFLPMGNRKGLAAFGLGWTVLVGTLLHLEMADGLRVGPDLVNSTLMTLLAFVVSRVTFLTRVNAYLDRRLIEQQQAELEKANAHLAESNERLRRLSLLDPLTEVPNRRFFGECLAREWKRAVRGRSPLSLVMIDLDHFKAYNDTYGHQAGDGCLLKVSAAISEVLKRPGDLLARYGGDEFAVILPQTDLSGARQIGDEVRRAVLAKDLLHRAGWGGRVTVSVGVASIQPTWEDSSASLLAAADKALYLAKAGGRNLAEVAPLVEVV